MSGVCQAVENTNFRQPVNDTSAREFNKLSWIENLDIRAEHNDLLSVNADAIVSPVTVNLEQYGKISQQIFGVGNGELLDDLSKIKSDLINNRLRLGEAVSLRCSLSYHIGIFERIIFVAMWDYQSEYNLNLFYKAYISCFRDAFQHNLKSIALPIMAYDGNIRLNAQAAVKAITELDQLKNSSEFSVENIYFVSTNNSHVRFIENEVVYNIY